MNELHTLSALRLREAFLTGEVSATQIAHHFLTRAQALNPKLGAFLTILEERTLMKAERLDQKRKRNEPLGKLAGVPIAIKDNMHIAGELTTCASQILKTYRAPFHATAVHALEQEDALLIGKANMDEFAMGSSNENSSFGPAYNPWDLKRVPGGSSGGSAAAVAARLAPLATGSDTGGSIRQPAAFTGIVGYKPTYSRVSRYGLVAFGSSLDQIGPLATCVSDAALAMEVMGHYDPHDATSLNLPAENYLDHLSTTLRDKVFGVPRRFLEGLKPEILHNFEESLNVLTSLGAKLVDINLDICKYSIAVYYILATAEASTNLARFAGIRYGHRSPHAQTLDQVYDLSRKEGFGPEVKKRIMLGTYVLSAGYQDAYYRKAQKVRTLIQQAFDTAFDTCDAIALPVTPSGAFIHNSISDPVEMYLQDIFTIPANLAGTPAISVPSGFTSEGLPLGLQIIGPQMHDVSVLSYAHAYERATSHNRIPPAFT